MTRNLHHYYPILRLKSGELRAISNINRRLDMFFTPIFEIVHDSFWETPKDENGNPQKDEYGNYLPKRAKNAGLVLKKQAKHLMNHCANERPMMIDMSDLTGQIEHSFSEHPMVRFFDEVRNTSKLSMIPVSGLESDSRPLQYQEAVRTCVEKDNCGVCLRLLPSDFNDPNFVANIEQHLRFWGVGPSKVIFLLDFGYVDSEIALIDYFNKIPFLSEWRDVVLASGAFPKNGEPTMWQPNNSYQMPRLDWINWINLVASVDDFYRKPSYADYTSLHPKHQSYEMYFIRPTAKIVWTLNNKWVMERGESTKKRGQFPLLAKALFGQEGLEDSLVNSCVADNLLIQIQEDEISEQEIKGDLTSWIGYSIDHHITFTILQLCDLFEQQASS